MPILHLVRHAQPDFGGDYDSITALGREQAVWLGTHYRELGVRFDRVMAGRLKRQRETLASLIAQIPDTPEPRYDERFDEYDAHGLLSRYAAKVDTDMRRTGDRRAYYTTLRRALLDWSADPERHDGETWTQFGERVREAVRSSQDGLDRDARILIVTSGGVIGRFVADILGADADAAIALNLQARNTGITEIAVGRSAQRLIAFNGIPHLERRDRAHALTYS